MSPRTSRRLLRLINLSSVAVFAGVLACDIEGARDSGRFVAASVAAAGWVWYWNSVWGDIERFTAWWRRRRARPTIPAIRQRDPREWLRLPPSLPAAGPGRAGAARLPPR